MNIIIKSEKWSLVTSDNKNIVTFKNRKRYLTPIKDIYPAKHNILIFESKQTAEAFLRKSGITLPGKTKEEKECIRKSLVSIQLNIQISLCIT